MPKSKYGPALFEVYDKASEEDAARSPGRKGPRTSGSAFKATISSLAKSLGANAETDHEEPMKRGDSGVRPPVALQDGRLHIALGSRGGGLVAAVLVLCACAMFAAGQWFGRQGGLADGRKQARQSIQRAALDEIEQARQRPPTEDLFAGIGVSPVAPKGTTATGMTATGLTATGLTATGLTAESRNERPLVARLTELAPVSLAAVPDPETTWVKGNTYVVVQSFRGDARQDVARAREFLAQHGIEAGVFGGTDRGYRLIATTGFNRKEPTQKRLAEQFLSKVRNVGKAYFNAGGRYKLEGYFATLKSDTW